MHIAAKYKKGDIVSFWSNEPDIHLLVMFGPEFDPQDVKPTKHIGVVTNVHEIPIGVSYVITTLKPNPGFLCSIVWEYDIISKYMFNILWIHGFAGKPDNDTVKEMRKRYPIYEFHSIEVDHHAIDSMEKINAFIQDHSIDLVAGTSLGGYYAMCAEFDGPKLVVNPVTDPVRDLKQFLGQNSYKPGRQDGQTDFIFTEEMLQEFGKLKLKTLNNTYCHHTPHDQVLGEDIKHDYIRMFSQRDEIEECILPNHFLTFRYIKSRFGEALDKILNKQSEKYINNK